MEMTPLPDSLQPFPLRIEDYELLDRAGVFEGRRVELIEGVIIAVNSEYRPHTRVKNELMYRLRRALEALGSNLEALVEPTLALPPRNMPEPDVVVASVSPNENDYFRLPDMVLVIEVGASTLRSDLDTKRRMYATHQLPEYWVVDVHGREVHQFWGPGDGVFESERTIPLAGELRSLTMPDLAIDGTGIL